MELSVELSVARGDDFLYLTIHKLDYYSGDYYSYHIARQSICSYMLWYVIMYHLGIYNNFLILNPIFASQPKHSEGNVFACTRYDEVFYPCLWNWIKISTKVVHNVRKVLCMTLTLTPSLFMDCTGRVRGALPRQTIISLSKRKKA